MSVQYTAFCRSDRANEHAAQQSDTAKQKRLADFILIHPGDHVSPVSLAVAGLRAFSLSAPVGSRAH
jgi:hypothetical protein